MEGRTLGGRYEIREELGRGGMGVVYLARDPVLQRDVAIKVLFPSQVTSDNEARFRSEAQVVAQMDHPAIVPIHDFGREDDSMFFVMPLVKGESLRQFLRGKGCRLVEVVEVVIGVAEALEYSHARGIVHRDIKPENIMVCREGEGVLRVRVMDFGLARKLDVSRLTRTGKLVGTMAYVSPEQVGGHAGDARSDLYALGTVLYECVAGRLPFPGELRSVLYRIAHEAPVPPTVAGAHIDAELETLVLSCLEKDPRRRPTSAGELARVLRGYRSRLVVGSEKMTESIGRTAAGVPVRSPFIGRTEELRELQTRLHLALAGECQLALVSGAAGVGKTRLLEEIEGMVRIRGIRVLHGRFVEKAGAFPFHGFCEVIQEYFRQKDSSTDAGTLPDLDDLAPDLVRLFPMLGEIDFIRSASRASSPSIDDEGERRPESKQQIFELLARTLIRLAEGKPLVLLLEALHGADASIDALHYVAQRLGATPTLILGTFREPVERRSPLRRLVESLRGDRRFVSISLLPLVPSDHRELVSCLVGSDSISDDLSARLYEETEGNALFTVELVGALREAGTLAPNEVGVWSLTPGAGMLSGTLPATIQEAVERRLDRLQDDVRDVLSIASILGRSFDYRDLESLAGGEPHVEGAIDTLVQEGILVESTSAREDRLTFCSGLVCDAVLLRLSRRRRHSLHRRCGEMLEKRHAGRLDRIAPKLLYHFSEGDVAERTVEYGLLCARRSLESFCHEDAIRFCRTSMEYLDEEWEGDRILEGEVRLILGQAHRMGGDVESALREIGTAAEVLERSERGPRFVSALLLGARVAWQARLIDETVRWVERGIIAARAADEKESLRQLLSLGATLANLRGDASRANEYLKQAEGLVREASEDHAEVPAGGRLRVGLANPVVARHPVELSLVEEGEVFANAFEPLLRGDGDGNLVPVLCERWEMLDAGARFRFHLRPDVRFHDGEPLTAASVKESFEMGLRATGGEPAPPFAPILGARAFAQGETDQLEGLRVTGEQELEIVLSEPLPVFPVLLTDERTAVVRSPAGAGPDTQGLVGTGPFRLASRSEKSILLTCNPFHHRGAPRLLELEFLHGLDAVEMARLLRSGELDVAGHLLPEDLEQIQKDPRFRRSVVEIPGGFVYFALFNCRPGAVTESAEVRRALCASVRTADLVFRTVGRFALPAHAFLPPGVLGHDPGRRGTLLPAGEAREVLDRAGCGERIVLRAAVHPLIQDRYGRLVEALAVSWEELGVELDVRTTDMSSYLHACREAMDIDVFFTRWSGDYRDPDDYTHSLFHSRHGYWSRMVILPQGDEILERARAEVRPGDREVLYRSFEALLHRESILLPLFHDVEYRVQGPTVRGLELTPGSPGVNYQEIGKEESSTEMDLPPGIAGSLRIPLTGRVWSLDPTLVDSVSQAEVVSCMYSTLTRHAGEAKIVPFLAEEIEVDEEGRVYRFRLRKGVQFHDGRRLSVRDVRFTMERLLRRKESKSRWLLAPISGARELLEGKGSDLRGFRIESAHRFTIELEEPISFFPGLLSDPALGIVPEGAESFDAPGRGRLVGCGPFRVTRFEPGQRLDLERHPSYFRAGIPRSGSLHFRFGIAPKDILLGFQKGRYSLAGGLYPEDVVNLRREAAPGVTYHETPAFSTALLAFSSKRGPLAEKSLRQTLSGAVDVEKVVKKTLVCLGAPARGLIPPGLLGEAYSSGELDPPDDRDTRERLLDKVELRVGVDPVFTRAYSSLLELLGEVLGQSGFMFRIVTRTQAELGAALESGKLDVAVVRTAAEYPDPHAIVDVLHSHEGILGELVGNPRLDRLIERARAEVDPRGRSALYREIEALVAREALVVPLFHEQVYRFARPEISGLQVSPWSPEVAYEDLAVESV